MTPIGVGSELTCRRFVRSEQGVESRQIGKRNINMRQPVRCLRCDLGWLSMRRLRGQFFATKNDALGRNDAVALASSNRFMHAIERVLSQQLQHLDELPSTGHCSMSQLKLLTKFGEFRRQTPRFIDFGVIQVGWLTFQQREVMKRIEHHLVLSVRPRVARNSPAVAKHFDPIDVRFDDDF